MGTIAYVIAQASVHDSVSDLLMISGVCVALSLLIGLTYYYAGPISERLGSNGMAIIARVMGIVLLAIGFAILTQGLRDLLPGLAGPL